MVNARHWALALTLFLSLTSLAGTATGAGMFTQKKFKWQATESAPRGYVMEIVGGSLSYHDGSGSLYVPDGTTIQGGWGLGISNHVVGDETKPLPNKLTISFFSYLENQFYQATFDLPYDNILKLFQDGYYSPNEGKHITYHKIIVGVAPGGAVSVWLLGFNKITEVFYGEAEKADLPWSRLTDATHITREEWVRKTVQESRKTPEGDAVVRKGSVPFGLWNHYRTQYSWQPLFTGMTTRDGIEEINYYNGEYDYLNDPLEKEIAARTRPVPKFIRFIWEQTKVRGRSYELKFNEAEIFDAFKKLGASNQPLQLEMRMTADDAGKKTFSVWLRHDKESIPLKQTAIEIYGVSDRKAETAK